MSRMTKGVRSVEVLGGASLQVSEVLWPEFNQKALLLICIMKWKNGTEDGGGIRFNPP